MLLKCRLPLAGYVLGSKNDPPMEGGVVIMTPIIGRMRCGSSFADVRYARLEARIFLISRY